MHSNAICCVLGVFVMGAVFIVTQNGGTFRLRPHGDPTEGLQVQESHQHCHVETLTNGWPIMQIPSGQNVLWP